MQFSPTIQIGKGQDFRLCKVETIATGDGRFFRFGVDVGGSTDYITVCLPKSAMKKLRAALIDDAQHNATPLDADVIKHHRQLTESEIVEYFENSNDLNSIASDVKKVLLPVGSKQDHLELSQLESDIEKTLSKLNITDIVDTDGNLTTYHQRDIGMALGIKNAGGFRSRILAVRDAIHDDYHYYYRQNAKKNGSGGVEYAF